jgi:hypothetical protein
MCHGDLPDSAASDPEGRRLYADCVEEYERMLPEFTSLPVSGRMPGLNGSIASFLAAESDGPVEQAFLGFGQPGLREAIFRLVARGCHSVVCVGGAGLVLPGQGAAIHLPEAVGQVLSENAGLDVCCVRPGSNPHVTAALIMASLEGALQGRGMPPRPSWEAPRIGGDTGVIVASAPDRQENMASIKRLSDYLQAKPQVVSSNLTRFMTDVAEGLEATGAFSAVRTGFMDFAKPDVETAASQLSEAGARQIIIAGMPALLGHHMLSWAYPDDAVDRLKKSCHADLMYVKPDPQSCAQEIGAMLRMRVLEASATARRQSLNPFS